jgi:hypothetical protein
MHRMPVLAPFAALLLAACSPVRDDAGRSAAADTPGGETLPAQGTAAQSVDIVPTAATRRGAERLAPFKKNLMEALRSGLEAGPVSAIEVCQVQAPAIAASLSVDGVRVGRSSHRLRNPSNTPPDWVAPIMDEYRASGSTPSPRAVALGDGRTGYVEPIILQPLCVTCHGNNVPADVQARIDELYPEDEATGFDVGDLRGVFWLEYPEG